MKTNKGV